MFKNKAFSLLEMLVVIGIISIVIGIGSVSYSSAQKKTRDARRKTDLKEIQQALESYNSDNGSYPTTNRENWGTCSATGHVHPDKDSGTEVGYVPGLAPKYMLKLPHDPREGQTYGTPECMQPGNVCYIYNSDGKDYKIFTHCGPETPITTSDPFYDPVRPDHAWQISSSETSLSTF